MNRVLGLPIAIIRKVQLSIDGRIKRGKCQAHPLAVLHRTSRIHNHRNPEAIRIGKGTHVLATLQTLEHGGKIEIGEFSYIGEYSYIWSSEHIAIGDRVLISHGVNIHDNISHPVSALARHEHYMAMILGQNLSQLKGVVSSAVTIGNDAWVGFNATILKGVTIGEGAIVGACSLVTKDVAPWTIVAGSPAREVGKSAR